MSDERADLILLLDPSARAGRTRYRLKVKDARDCARAIRNLLGNSRDDTPTVEDLLYAVRRLSTLLNDATEGDARVVVELGQRRASMPPTKFATASEILATFRA